MSGKWINLGVMNTPRYIALQSFVEALYDSRAQPTKGAEDAFGDLRSLLQRGFTGGEDWSNDWAECFVDEKAQAQAMAYLSDYFGRAITTMDEAAFEFDFFALKTLHQKMEAAGLHERFDQPDLSDPSSTWGLDVLSDEQIARWEAANHRSLPQPLRRVYQALFGGAMYFDGEVPINWWFLSGLNAPFPNTATLEEVLTEAGVNHVERRLSKIQYGINQLANGASTVASNLQYAKLVQPKLAKALVLERYDNDSWADYISILVEFGPLDQHIIELVDVIKDPEQCTINNEGPLGLWLIKTYLNAWLDMGV